MQHINSPVRLAKRKRMKFRHDKKELKEFIFRTSHFYDLIW